jgi:hypothetical protein
MLGKRTLLIAALVPTLVGATPAHAIARSSGLRGLVTRSPATPVCVAGVPCSVPATNTLLVFSRGGRIVRTRTDSVGRYRVGLTPGLWTVSTVTVPRIGSRITPRAVRVFATRLRIVNFDIDTGIR